MCRRAALAVVLLAVVFPAVALPVAAVGGAGGSPAAPDHASVDARESAGPNFTRADPSVVMRINVTETGDARWTVASRFLVENDTEAAAFRAMAADVRNRTGPVAGLGYSVETFRRFAVDAEGQTDRSDPMRIEEPSWTARVDEANDTAVLALEFTWTNFADSRDNGSRVVLGDVFGSTQGGAWFPVIASDQRLVLNAPPGYLVRENTLPYPIQEGSITVEGPANLTAQEVSIVYERTDSPDGTTPPTTDDGGIPQALLGGGVLALAVAAVLVGYLLYRRPAGGPGATAPDVDAATDGAQGGTEATDGSGGTEAGTPTGDVPPGDATGPEADAAGATGTGTSAGEGGEAASEAAGAGAAAAEEEDETAVELLSDEERVERLLDENGGRMKQSNIVSETGWSNAKVSQLLSSMDEEDRIDKLRIGRENLITLPDEDVGDFD